MKITLVQQCKIQLRDPETTETYPCIDPDGQRAVLKPTFIECFWASHCVDDEGRHLAAYAISGPRVLEDGSEADGVLVCSFRVTETDRVTQWVIALTEPLRPAWTLAP